MKVITRSASKTRRGRNLTLVWGIHPFPVGKILVALSAEGLCWLGINCGGERLAREFPGAFLVEDQAVTRKPAAEIAKLWPTGIDKLSVPLVLYGTPFQLKVWKELLKIKPGKLETYETVAKKIGKPKAMRAVGSAVGRNTVSIVVPCHRVVNKQEGRINYGWGPDIKLALLRKEGAL
jgi:AraC family transcriptional regulator of adaptative response/methylated-DNA-[protein]-cysteine methyltransferase